MYIVINESIMSTIQVGEIDSSSPVDDLAARLSPPIDLPEGFMDYTEMVLCLLLGATILRCFYARICKRKESNQKEKKA